MRWLSIFQLHRECLWEWWYHHFSSNHFIITSVFGHTCYEGGHSKWDFPLMLLVSLALFCFALHPQKQPGSVYSNYSVTSYACCSGPLLFSSNLTLSAHLWYQVLLTMLVTACRTCFRSAPACHLFCWGYIGEPSIVFPIREESTSVSSSMTTFSSSEIVCCTGDIVSQSSFHLLSVAICWW